MTTNKRIAVFVSGLGTTLDALCEAEKSGNLNATVVAVISNHCDIKAGDVARKHGLLYAQIPRKGVGGDAYKSTEAWSEMLYHWANGLGQNPDLIVLAGFSQKLFVPPEWQGRILNIHPSLLPAYGGKGMYGLNVHEAVLKAGERYSGCSVHVVDNVYDNGPILGQIRVPVLEGDTPETLQNRVKSAETILYPQIISDYEQTKTKTKTQT